MKQGLTVLVDWETADAIMEEHLLNTYTHMAEDVKRLKKIKKPQDWQKEDLEQFQSILAALDVVGPYFVFDFKKKVKKNAK